MMHDSQDLPWPFRNICLLAFSFTDLAQLLLLTVTHRRRAALRKPALDNIAVLPDVPDIECFLAVNSEALPEYEDDDREARQLPRTTTA